MGFCNLLNDYKPHFFLILSNLCLSIFIVLLKSVIEGGVSGPVFVVYEHILASVLLFTLAFFFERATRPPLTFRVFCWAFLLGFLQITLTQLLLTSSIRYIAPSTQSILLNTVPVIVFVLAVSFRQEIFRFRSVDGQAKIWGILISTFGATLMIVWTGPEIRRLEQIGRAMSTGNRVIGFLMMAGAVLAAASSNLFVAHVTKKYDMELTLAAMMCFSGTLQTAIVAAIAEKSASAWEIKFKGPEILAILYGGNDLPTLLTDLSNSPSWSSNSLSLDLVDSISQTLTHALSVARKCRDSNLSDGKLSTQSDIDSVVAKLDQHVKDGDLLIRSGVLQDGLVVCSKREAVRAEARNFITRLQIGNPDSKSAAMDSLLGLLQEDDKNVLIAVAQGAVTVLVRLLDSSNAEIKEKAVSAISRVSMVDSSKHVLVAEGILLLNRLLRVLESGSGFAKERACIALRALSSSKDNARAIASRGGISSLLDICQAGTPGSQSVAAGVLRNLAMFSEITESFMEENAIPVLLGLSAYGNVVAQEGAIGCLSNLVSEDESLKLLVAREGGIGCLKNFWDTAPTVGSLEAAIGLLRNLSSCSLIAPVLVSDGFVPRLVGPLSCAASGVRIDAAKAVFDLGFNSKTRKEIGESGCIPPLIKMIDAKAVEEKEAAGKSLSSLMLYAGNRRIFRKEDNGIEATVQLLHPSIQNLDKKYPVSILASIVRSKKCRKQMVASGACEYLQKLVEMDVQGAKKLLESLGRSKLWGILS